MYGDNVFEKDGIRRDRTGDGEKTRCLCGKRGIFNRDGPAMGPQIIRQLERRASRRSASFFHALASPGRPGNGGGASGAYQPAEGRKALIQGRFRAQEGPLGPSRKSQQQTKRTGFAALEDSIADEAPEGKRAKRANRALNRAGINSRGAKTGVRRRGSAGRARYELLNGALLPGRRRGGTRGKRPEYKGTFSAKARGRVPLPGIRGFSRGEPLLRPRKQRDSILIYFLIIAGQKIRRFRRELHGSRRGRFFRRRSRRNMSRR